MVTIRPFKKEDLCFEPIEPDITPFTDEFVEAIEQSGLAVTGMRNGKVVGCGGVHPDGPQAELWLRLSKEVVNFPRTAMRIVLEAERIIEKTYGFEKLFAVIRSDFCESEKIVKRLGFEAAEEKAQNGRMWKIYSKVIHGSGTA